MFVPHAGLSKCYAAGRGRKSLRQLSAAKALQLLPQDDDAIQTFNSIRPATQRLFFSCLWTNYKRLLVVERQHEAYQRLTPCADRALTNFSGKFMSRKSMGYGNNESRDTDQMNARALRITFDQNRNIQHREEAFHLPASMNRLHGAMQLLSKLRIPENLSIYVQELIATGTIMAAGVGKKPLVYQDSSRPNCYFIASLLYPGGPLTIRTRQ